MMPASVQHINSLTLIRHLQFSWKGAFKESTNPSKIFSKLFSQENHQMVTQASKLLTFHFYDACGER